MNGGDAEAICGGMIGIESGAEIGASVDAGFHAITGRRDPTFLDRDLSEGVSLECSVLQKNPPSDPAAPIVLLPRPGEP